MSTHKSKCAVCGTNVYCCNDEHVLGSGHGGCNSEGEKIDFCSLDCFLWLQKSMAERLEIAKELYPEWFRHMPAKS